MKESDSPAKAELYPSSQNVSVVAFNQTYQTQSSNQTKNEREDKGGVRLLPPVPPVPVHLDMSELRGVLSTALTDFAKNFSTSPPALVRLDLQELRQVLGDALAAFGKELTKTGAMVQVSGPALTILLGSNASPVTLERTNSVVHFHFAPQFQVSVTNTTLPPPPRPSSPALARTLRC